MWQGINKRNFPRVERKIVVNARFKDGVEHVTAHTENIGCGGICVLLDKELEKFSQLTLQLQLEDGKGPIECDGRVVWSVKSGQLGNKAIQYDIGIEFVNISVAELERISEEVLKDER